MENQLITKLSPFLKSIRNRYVTKISDYLRIDLNLQHAMWFHCVRKMFAIHSFENLLRHESKIVKKLNSNVENEYGF